ncbi:MAG: helix-turn-helix transcriptional regulator [Bacteriovorax sp.]|nr:helix-turn-helix transcriptional regulator [Bacteriovorax sp.]
MKTFNNIATFVKKKRTEHHRKYSQDELSTLLGLKSNHLISKIEAAACSVPLKTLPKLAKILEVHPDEFKEAIIKDHQESLDRYFKKLFF